MTQTATDANLELLTFRIADQDFALDIMSVREIRGWTHTTPLPHAPSYMCGVINLRGTVLPVMDLAERLGLPKTERNARNVIIVVKQDNVMTGLLVDAVSDIVALMADDMQLPPDMAPGNTPGVVSALTLINDKMVRVLDLRATIQTPESIAA